MGWVQAVLMVAVWVNLSAIVLNYTARRKTKSAQAELEGMMKRYDIELDNVMRERVQLDQERETYYSQRKNYENMISLAKGHTPPPADLIEALLEWSGEKITKH